MIITMVKDIQWIKKTLYIKYENAIGPEELSYSNTLYADKRFTKINYIINDLSDAGEPTFKKQHISIKVRTNISFVKKRKTQKITQIFITTQHVLIEQIELYAGMIERREANWKVLIKETLSQALLLTDIHIVTAIIPQPVHPEYKMQILWEGNGLYFKLGDCIGSRDCYDPRLHFSYHKFKTAKYIIIDLSTIHDVTIYKQIVKLSPMDSNEAANEFGVKNFTQIFVTTSAPIIKEILFYIEVMSLGNSGWDILIFQSLEDARIITGNL